MKERRRDRRTTLRKPVLAQVDSSPVFVIDVSRGGVRVAHRSQLPPPGAICRLDLPTENGDGHLDCAIVHTVRQHAASAAESLFQSGLRIVTPEADAREGVQKLLKHDKKR